MEVRWLEESRPIFSGEDDLLHFASAVARELHNLLDEWGTEQYLKEWRYSFPLEAQQRLEQGVKQERERRRIGNQENQSA